MNIFWPKRENYLIGLRKANRVFFRLTKAGKNRERWPRNVYDMFYRNYLDAEADIMFKELFSKKRFTRSKRYQINKKGRRKYGHTLFCGTVTVGGGLYDKFKQLQ